MVSIIVATLKGFEVYKQRRNYGTNEVAKIANLFA